MTRRSRPRSLLCERTAYLDIPLRREASRPHDGEDEMGVLQRFSRTSRITRGKEDELES